MPGLERNVKEVERVGKAAMPGEIHGHGYSLSALQSLEVGWLAFAKSYSF